MTDNEIMSLEKAMFILRHGNAESMYKYFEAIDRIEKEINRQKAEIEKLKINLEEAHIDIKEHLAKIERLREHNVSLVKMLEAFHMDHERELQSMRYENKLLTDFCEEYLGIKKMERERE